MTLEELAGGDLVTLRIYKRWITNPNLIWANNYEFSFLNESGGSSDVNALIDAVLNVEETIHLEFVVFDRAVVSTLVPDGVPYNPTTFIVRDASEFQGVRAAAGVQPLDIKNVLFARFETGFGRPGRRFYRGCLNEGDVDATASGEYRTLTLANQTLFNTALNGLRTPNLSDIGWRLVLVGDTPTPNFTRGVTEVTASQVTSRQLRRRTRRGFGEIGGGGGAI